MQTTVRRLPVPLALRRRSEHCRVTLCAVATSKSELHDLLAKPALEGIPTLILGNKNDLDTSIGVDALIEKLDLKSIPNRELCCYSISAKNAVNIDITMDWLIKHSKASR